MSTSRALHYNFWKEESSKLVDCSRFGEKVIYYGLLSVKAGLINIYGNGYWKCYLFIFLGLGGVMKVATWKTDIHPNVHIPVKEDVNDVGC